MKFSLCSLIDRIDAEYLLSLLLVRLIASLFRARSYYCHDLSFYWIRRVFVAQSNELPASDERGCTKGVYNRFVVTIATALNFFSFFFISTCTLASMYLCGRGQKTGASANAEFINLQQSEVTASCLIPAYKSFQFVANHVFALAFITTV